MTIFRAEWEKIAGNRWPVAMFVAVFPVGFTALGIFILIAALISSEFRDYQQTLSGQTWDSLTIGVWAMANNQMGRWMFAAFTAIVFAGEYQYGTWKNLVPRRKRAQLILTKFFTVTAFIVAAWVTTTIIVGIGGVLIANVLGTDYGSFDGETVRTFINDYILQMLIAVTSVFIACGYAALVAMFSKNILISVFIAILINIMEYGILVQIVLMERVFGVNWMFLHQITPSYNLPNINTWVTMDRGYELFNMAEPYSMSTSVVIIILWVVGLIAFTTYSFVKQDITT